jgi:hypothetical protein
MDKKVKKNTEISFTLNDKEQEKYEEWIGHIKAIHGQYGLFTWKYTPNGIGMELRVFSHLTKTELDLTDVESW